MMQKLGEKENFITKFLGDKAFYKMVLAIAIPIMVQEGITNFVNMLDNLMVGRVGTDQMSGVSIVNQLLFVFNLSCFGGLAGAGIFVSQFKGKKDNDGIRNVFKIKIIIGAAILIVGVLLLSTNAETFINLFIHDGSDTGDPEATMAYGLSYMRIMLIGLFPYVASQICCSTLREMGETLTPMKAGIVAVLTNMTFNYLLIFGKFGFPKLGTDGAAIATVISRFVELTYVIIYIRTHRRKCIFATDLFSTHITGDLFFKVIAKSVPLLINETLWGGGQTMLAQCYSTRGLAVVAAVNIANVIGNVFIIAFLALGQSIAIIIGRLLGANKMDEAKDTDRKLTRFSILVSFAMCLVLMCISPFFPKLYNTTDEVRFIATKLIFVYACMMPFDAFNNAAYFTLRSGGKTAITMIFDSGSIWLFGVLSAFLLSRFTAVAIVPLYAIVRCTDVFKTIVGFFMTRSNIWLNNIVSNEED